MMERIPSIATVFFCIAFALSGCGGGGGSVPGHTNNSGGASNGSNGSNGSGGTNGNNNNSGSSGSQSIAQTHVLTADFLGGYAGTHTVTAAQAAPVLSWAEIDPSDGNADSAAGIKTMDYIDPFRQATTDPLFSSDAQTFSTDCGGVDITIPYGGGIQYLMNPGSTDLQAKINAWQARELTAGHLDAFFYDDVDTLYGVPTMPCGATQNSWDASNASFIAASNNPVVFNGYAMDSNSALEITGTNVVGGVAEGCYATGSQPSPPYTTGTQWVTDENLELAAAAANRLFFCYNNGSQNGAAFTNLRLYIYASFLLTYSATSSVLWDTFTTTSGLHVFPETQLVPANPLVSSPGSVSSLKSATGLYVREYGACYLSGLNAGACAVVVNSDASASHAMPTLSGTYTHTFTVNGAGALDGGTTSVTGSAAPSTVPAETGLILMP